MLRLPSGLLCGTLAGSRTEPVYTGDHPEIMRKRCGDRLPEFTAEEKALLTGRSDFFGRKSSGYAEWDDSGGHYESRRGTTSSGGFWGDISVKSSADPKWKETEMGWPIVPWGFRKLLLWVQARYSPKCGMQVTENGCAIEPSIDPPVRQRMMQVWTILGGSHTLRATSKKCTMPSNWGRCSAVLRVEYHGQLRMGIRIREEVRSRPCRLHHSAAHTQELFEVVQQCADLQHA